ncbi:MAG: SDR family NAD(P)-dependent oxidoreductase [Motilibacteraceae bacterium]
MTNDVPSVPAGGDLTGGDPNGDDQQILTGRTALVTGGSRGIGFAAARGLARQGATVVLLARDAERLRESADRLQGEGLRAAAVACDVADPVAVRGLPEVLGELADVDVLVNCAGVMSDRMAKTLRCSDEEWRRVLATNLDGPFALCSTFVPGMVQRGWGRVVNVSACLGRFSGPGTNGGLAPYRVSKAGLNALTKNLAAELGQGRKGVLVDAMCPNHCATDMGGPQAPRTPEQGAETIVWLASRTGEGARTGLLWEDREEVTW